AASSSSTGTTTVTPGGAGPSPAARSDGAPRPVMSAHSIRKSSRRSRFRESGQPCSAWNHVRHVLGGTPGTEAAYRGAGQVPLLAGGIAHRGIGPPRDTGATGGMGRDPRARRRPRTWCRSRIGPAAGSCPQKDGHVASCIVAGSGLNSPSRSRRVFLKAVKKNSPPRTPFLLTTDPRRCDTRACSIAVYMLQASAHRVSGRCRRVDGDIPRGWAFRLLFFLAAMFVFVTTTRSNAAGPCGVSVHGSGNRAVSDVRFVEGGRRCLRDAN